MTEPLVPEEVNLRGLPWMRLDTERLLNSDLFLLSSGEELKAAVALWCRSWSQQPAGSLPDDDRLLAALSGAQGRWRRVRAMALRGWVLCDDGRLYHPVVAEQVMVAWKERLAFQEREGNRREREDRYRKEHKQLRDDLRELGIRAAWNAPIEELRERLAAAQQRRTNDAPTTHLRRTTDAPATAKTGRDGTVKAFTPETPARTGVSEGSSERLARALGEVGYPECAPTFPGLADAEREGVTEEELKAIALKCGGKPLAYIIETARGRRRDAAERAAARGQRPAAPDTDPKIQAEAVARVERNRKITRAEGDYELGLIDQATRDRRIADAEAAFAAACAVPAEVHG